MNVAHNWSYHEVSCVLVAEEPAVREALAINDQCVFRVYLQVVQFAVHHILQHTLLLRQII